MSRCAQSQQGIHQGFLPVGPAHSILCERLAQSRSLTDARPRARQMARPASPAGIRECTDAGTSWLLTLSSWVCETLEVFGTGLNEVLQANCPCLASTREKVEHSQANLRLFYPASTLDAWTADQICDIFFFPLLQLRAPQNLPLHRTLSTVATSVRLSSCVHCLIRAMRHLNKIRRSSVPTHRLVFSLRVPREQYVAHHMEL